MSRNKPESIRDHHGEASEAIIVVRGTDVKKGLVLGSTMLWGHRVEPPVKKRRPKSFPLMLKPRQALRQQLVQQAFRS
jgi:hypothetical protein